MQEAIASKNKVEGNDLIFVASSREGRFHQLCKGTSEDILSLKSMKTFSSFSSRPLLIVALQTPREPITERESSVMVPVLSNTKVWMRPATLTRVGEMQKILHFLNLYIENTTPHVIAAGRAGGTQIVSKSSDRSINTGIVECDLSIKGTLIKNPTIAMMAIIATNLYPSV